MIFRPHPIAARVRRELWGTDVDPSLFPVLVGEQPSVRASTHEEPLMGTSGRRLAQLMGVTFPYGYSILADRVTLCASAGKWHQSEAEERSCGITSEAMRQGRTIVLLGRKVRQVFEGVDIIIDGVRFFESQPRERVWTDWITTTDVRLRSKWCWTGHPSGLEAWWGEPKNAQASRLMLSDSVARAARDVRTIASDSRRVKILGA